MELGLGNNHVVGRAEITADGAQVFKITPGSNGNMLVNVNIWDASGVHVAKLRRGAWSFKADGYEVSTSPTNLTLRRGDSTVFAVVSDGQRFWVRALDLFTRSGDRLVIDEASGDLEFFERETGRRVLAFTRCLFNATVLFEEGTGEPGEATVDFAPDAIVIRRRLAPGASGVFIDSEFGRRP